MLAVLYDFHGNLPALEAVLADAGSAGADEWLLGGDYSAFGAWPEQTVERLRELPNATWLRGNWERWTAQPGEAPPDEVIQGALSAARAALAAALVEELGALPQHLVRGETAFCHGSPGSDVRSFLPEPADDEAELIRGVGQPRLVFGHTHLAFRRRSATGVELFNPGSVGLPFDGDPRAAYALLGPDATLEHRRVAYDHAASAGALRERYGSEGWAGAIAGRIERAAT